MKDGQTGTPVCGRCKEALDVSGAPQEVDADGLARVVASATVPVLVDFWAPWCGPCKAVAPAVDAIARERAGKWITLKLNTDQSPAAGSAHRIQGIPTFVVFKGGAEAARQSGALPKQALTGWLDSV